MAVSKRLRYEVLRRDGFACTYCGCKAPDVELTIDHVLPVSLGGSDDASNLTAACVDCNAGKSSSPADTPMVDAVDLKAAMWRRAMAQAAAETIAAEEEERRAFAPVEAEFEGWYKLGVSEWQSIRMVYQRGLPVVEIAEAAAIARDNDNVKMSGVWRYFMGVCWRKIDALERRAEQIMAEIEAATEVQSEPHWHALACACGITVEPYDDEPDDTSVTWSSAYRCLSCGSSWTAPWEMDGSPVPGHDYSPDGLGGVA